MQAEVDGSEGRLEGGKLGPGEGAVGHYAVNEGLKDGAAEEGAIAGGLIRSVKHPFKKGRKKGGGEASGPDDVIGGGVEENRAV